MKALITGITGFAGSHLADHLLQLGYEVAGTIRSTSSLKHVSHIRSELQLFECDLTDEAAVENVIGILKPERVFHLAAQSFVPASWAAPMETIHNNLSGQIHLLEAMRKHCPASRILIACSSEEYGQVEGDEVPIKETNPLRPLSPYAVSKIAQNLLGYQYYKNYGIHAVCVRTFNHTGPRHGEQFVTSNFAKQIAEIEKGLKPPVLYVGNLEARRDFTDVRDIVRAYGLALDACDPGEVYNISSGTGREIREMLNILLGFSTTAIDIQEDAARLRPSDVKALIGDYTKFHRKTGWRPEISFEVTMLDLLNYWRQMLAQ
ncbi:GDP-mannose 4,6-dehydratase [Paenibacillus sp. NEAU-GSW1]|uniref:GDP-mannose 4,6-dehydratase n=1 Tax=Paenibacillus sp. NEAU-GSW1 TaxID=2682486 RepID=UPI0012E210D0|nr:GDP-mannose 4,6-dehydratase [Paenibacillus sp. NEAU-GSW1]MUT68743.1 NAD-dependent epimerase/dehydratase family protein [Paenibacillus sp. NEAU-GSW1]